MKKIALMYSFFTLISCQAQQKDSIDISDPEWVKVDTELTDDQINDLTKVRINYQLRGSTYAFSSKRFAKSSNGEWQSANVAEKITDEFEDNGLYLYLNNDEYVVIDSTYLGHRLYLVNTSGKKVDLRAQDSRISIVAEVLNEEGEWVSITYLPNSWCGNSYHTITLGNNEYWSFNMPVYDGKFDTYLRYTIIIGEEQIISNVIEASISKNQMDPERKQGHTPQGIMDPYDE